MNPFNPTTPDPSPRDIYIEGYRKRIAAAEDAARNTPTGASLANLAMVLQEAVTVDLNLRSFVARMNLSSDESGPFRWTCHWNGRHPLADLAVRAATEAPDVGGDSDLSHAAMVLAAERVNQGIAPKDLESTYTREGLCAVRGSFLIAEAALRHGDTDLAVEKYQHVVRMAPHVTVGHRRLGEIAWKRGDHRSAIRHYEAACATPSKSWMLADQSFRNPVGMASFPGWLDFVSFRGHVFAVSAEVPYIGILGLGENIYKVPDTAAYRIWSKRIAPPLKKIKRTIIAVSGLRPYVERRRIRRLAGTESFPPSALRILILRLIFGVRGIDESHRDVDLESLIRKIDVPNREAARPTVAQPRPWA